MFLTFWAHGAPGDIEKVYADPAKINQGIRLENEILCRRIVASCLAMGKKDQKSKVTVRLLMAPSFNRIGKDSNGRSSLAISPDQKGD